MPAHSCLLTLVLISAIAPRVLQVTELSKRFTVRRIGRHPVRLQFLNTHLQVDAKLLVDFCLKLVSLSAEVPEWTPAAMSCHLCLRSLENGRDRLRVSPKVRGVGTD